MMTGKFGSGTMMMFLAVFVMCSAIFFGGCAKQKVWTKNGLNQDEFDRDLAKCSREALSSASSLALSVDFNNSSDLERGLDRSMTKDNLIKKCMYSNGYKLDDK